MSFPFNGTITRASNGTVELTPDNQFDLGKLSVGAPITVADGAPKVVKKSATKKAATKKATKTGTIKKTKK